MVDIFIEVSFTDENGEEFGYTGKLLQYKKNILKGKDIFIIQRNNKDRIGLAFSNPKGFRVLDKHEKEWYIENKW